MANVVPETGKQLFGKKLSIDGFFRKSKPDHLYIPENKNGFGASDF